MTAARSDRRRWLILAAALIVQIAVSAAVLGFPALVPFVRRDLHLTIAQAGLFATAPAVGSFALLTTIGWAVDRFGDRVVLVTGAVLTGALTVAASVAASYPILVTLLALVGAGSATPTPAGSTAIMHEFDAADRGVIMSVRQTGIPIGGAIGALLLPMLALPFGWRRAMVVAAIASVVAAAACVGLYAIAGGSDSNEHRHPSSGIPLVHAVRLRDATVAGACGGVLAAAQFSVLSFLVLYLLQTWQIPVLTGSLVLAAVQIVGACGRIFWGWLSGAALQSNRSLTLVMVTGAAALASIVFGTLPTATNAGVVIAVALLLGGCALGWNGVYITLLAELAHPGFEGRAISVGMTVTQVGIVVGPSALGLLVDATGSFRFAWILLGAALALAALVLRLGSPARFPRLSQV